MISYNKVIMMGNLTRDPEIRYTQSGTPVTNFRIAVNSRFKQADGLKEEVCFIDVVVFGKQAENCSQYLNKGGGVMVEGRLQQNRWESNDGQKRSRHEVVAQMVRFLPKRQEAAVSPGGQDMDAGGMKGEPSAGGAAEVEWPEESKATEQDVPF